MTLVTRSLSPDEFGTWGVITGLLAYGVTTATVVTYWTTRDTARSVKSGKTSVLGGGLLSFGGMLIYFFVIFLIFGNSSINQEVLIFGIILIPIIYFRKILSSMNLGWKPQIISYTALVGELVKILSAFFLIYLFDMGVVGVIASFGIGITIANIIQLIYLREKIRNKFNFTRFKSWIKNSWLTLYLRIPSFFQKTDIIIFIALTGSLLGQLEILQDQ